MIAWRDIYGYNNCEEIHRYVLPQLPPQATVVELGVGYGRGMALLAALREELGLDFRLVGVDCFMDTQELVEAGYSRLSAERVCRELGRVGVPAGSYEILTSDSAAAAQGFDKAHYVFADDDHRLEGVRRVLRAWWPKIVPAGFMGGHDWDMSGVREAVSEVFLAPQLFLDNYCNSWLQRKD